MRKTLLVLLLMPFIARAQKIKDNSYDKFDSLYKVESTDVDLYGGLMRQRYLSLSASKYKFESYRFTKVLGREDYHISFLFKAEYTLSTDGKSEIKFELDNGQILTYINQGSYSISTAGDFATIAIFVTADDPLFGASIKTIRISPDGPNHEYVLSEKAKKKLLDCLKLIKDTNFIM